MAEESPEANRSKFDEVSSILTQIDNAKFPPSELQLNASVFLRDMHSVWINNGGTESGKNRNSLNRTNELVSSIGKIKSLRTKLSGKTKVYRDDAEILISLFLTHWKYVGSSARNFAGIHVGYEPYPSKDLTHLQNTLLDLMFSPDSDAFRRGVLLSTGQDHISGSIMKRNRKTRDIIFENYPKSDALITLSRSKVVIGHTPGETIKRIAETISLLFEKSNEKNRGSLIWIVDIGSRKTESQDSYDAYFNVEFLSVIFKSLYVFDDSKSHDVIEWVNDNAIVIIGSLSHDEISQLYRDKAVAISDTVDNWPWITAQHVLPREIPMAWMQSGKLQDVYGENFGAFDHGTFNVFVHESNQTSNDESAARPIELSYFAHGLSRYDDDEPGVARGVELPSPHETYDQAFQIVYSAASQRLARPDLEGMPIKPEEALAHLRQLGFGVLRIEELLELHKLIRKNDGPHSIVSHSMR